ncbi:MAG: putative LPS assembly protein LptD [Nitrospiraceae bacterium]|nr:putative LPS assembly protein LptD [Nitrospiraceae bacterium]
MACKKTIPACLLVLLGILFPKIALAIQTDIYSQQLTSSKGQYFFHHSVRVVRNDFTATSDNAIYNATTKEFHFMGHFFFEDPFVKINSDSAVLNVDDRSGTIYNGTIFFKKEHSRLKGVRIEKSSGPPEEATYKVFEGAYTACKSDCPDWSIGGRRITVNPSGMAVATDATFMVKDTPVLYAPVFPAPVFKEKKSGFLSPTFGFSTFSGFRMDLPYYWVISDKEDLTAALEVHSRRAAGAVLDGRFLELNGLEGEDKLTYLNDWKDNKNYLALSGTQIVPFGFLAVDVVNHGDFHQLFNQNFEQRARRYLESDGEARLYYPGTGKLYLQTRYFEDLAPGADQQSVPERLPTLGFFLYPRQLGSVLGSPFILEGRTEDSYFWREHGQSADRLEIAPRISYVFGDGLDIYQAAGASLRSYQLTGPTQDFAEAVTQYQATATARLRRTFGNGITHYLEPSVGFLYQDVAGQQSPVVFDELETQTREALIQFQLENRLKNKGGQFMEFRVTDQYDARQDYHPLQPLNINLWTTKPFYINSVLTLDPYSRNVGTFEADSSFKVAKATSVSISERFSRLDNTWLNTVGVQRQLTKKLWSEASLWYDLRGGGFQLFHTTLVYKTECWGARLVFSRKPGDTSVYFNVQLQGIGQGSANEPTSPAPVPLITPVPSGKTAQNITAPDWSSMWSSAAGANGQPLQADENSMINDGGIHVPAEWMTDMTAQDNQPAAPGPFPQTD